MSEQKENKRNLLQRLRHRYRLVVMNDDSFEENFSLRLTPLGFLILLGSVTIIMTILVTSLIAFTPIREYIPGYADVGMRRELISMAMRSDSLEQALIEQNLFNENIANVLKGNIKPDTSRNKPDKSKEYEKVKLNASPNEALLKQQIESQDKYSLSFGAESSKSGISNFFFFTPLKGVVSEQFKSKERHYGIDIVGPENEPIKVALDGTVILSTWSSETGYTISVQHSNNLVSVYKHN